MPRRHHKKPDDTNAQPEWVRVRDRLINKIGSGFLFALIGNRGTGKTQISQQSVLACCASGRTSLYIRAMTIFLRLRATYRSETETELGIIQTLQAPRLLIIDEVQERGESEWENRNLNHLIDLRYGDMTDTLLIANLTPKAFAESLGASIVDRLRETGGIIECQWPSFRKMEQTK